MSSTTVTILVVAVILVAAVAAFAYQTARRRQTERLRDQYGHEYDRVVDRAESQREAESELRDRAKRIESYPLHRLDAAQREDFERRWTDVQAQFVDDPGTAVRNADRLVTEVMSARGYPVDDFDQRADDLSVRHADLTQRYRESRRIAQANLEGTVTTEELRQAVTSYRSLVHALLVDDPDEPDGTIHDDTPDARDIDETTGRETRA